MCHSRGGEASHEGFIGARERERERVGVIKLSLLSLSLAVSLALSLALALNWGSLRGNTLSVTMSDGQAGSSVFEPAFTVQYARLVYTLRIRKLES